MAGQYNLDTVFSDSQSRIIQLRLRYWYDGQGTITDTDDTGGIKIYNADTTAAPAADFFTVASNRIIDVSALGTYANNEPVAAVKLMCAYGMTNTWQQGANAWNIVDSEGNVYIDLTEDPIKFNAKHQGGWARSDAETDATGDLYFAPKLKPANAARNQSINVMLEFRKKI